MTIEVEVKSLLGTKEKADIFRTQLLASGEAKLVYKGKSINHYFLNPKDFSVWYEKLSGWLKPERLTELKSMIEKASDISVRTRETETDVILVVKIAIDKTTSSNGISRLEFEEKTKMTLSELDQQLLDADFSYQAKWSRVREEYKYQDFSVCLDCNAGYGYLVEFELSWNDQAQASDAKNKILAEMQKFELQELDQARLARMFDYYNKHWTEYYGTDKVFSIE